MTGAEVMVRCLEEEGVKVVFGYPGAAICPFYDELRASKIRHVLVRQEQNAGHMASGYARESGEVGVCVVTSGPGATNLITGIATAYMDSIPIIAITGQVPSDLLGRDIFQEIDINGAVMPFIKHSTIVKDAKELPRVFKEAFHIASTGRPGPVLIDIPVDIQNQEIAFQYPEQVDIRGYKPSVKGNALQIKRVCESLSGARQPLICAGGGVFSSHAQREVAALSETAGIPVVTTMMGLGILPTGHPMNLGMIGSFGTPVANRALEETDLLVIIGARVGDRAVVAPSAVEERSRTIHIDIDPAEIGKNLSTTVPLVGDIKQVLKQLLALSPKTDSALWTARQRALREAELSREPFYSKSSVTPARFMKALGERLFPDASVVADVGQNQIWAAKYLPIQSGRFLTSGGLGTMGYSLPAALGVKMANPERQTVVVCGDGSFQMMMNELSTMVEQKLDVKIVLMVNRRLGMVNEIQKDKYSGPFGVFLEHSPDFSALAAAFGVRAARCANDDEIERSVEEMLSAGGPFLLECAVSPDEGTKNV